MQIVVNILIRKEIVMAANIQNVSLKRDEEIKDLEDIGKDMGIDTKPPVVIRALIRKYKKDREIEREISGGKSTER